MGSRRRQQAGSVDRGRQPWRRLPCCLKPATTWRAGFRRELDPESNKLTDCFLVVPASWFYQQCGLTETCHHLVWVTEQREARRPPAAARLEPLASAGSAAPARRASAEGASSAAADFQQQLQVSILAGHACMHACM